MEKLTGHKINCAVFISGKGTNLFHIIKNSKKKKFPIQVSLVISNKFNAPGLKFAKKNNIPTKVFNIKNISNFEKKVLDVVKKKKIKLICLAGFMRILSKKFIKSFKYKIINIHPSLLPKYKGLNTHAKVLKNKERFSGCTIHYVSSKLDSGKIILQKKIKVKKHESLISLQKRVLKLEHSFYSKAIKDIFS